MAEIGEGVAADEYEILVDRESDLGKRIRVSLDFLCKSSTNLQEVLVHLRSNNVLSQHESEAVEHKESNYDRFRQLFTFLIQRLDHRDNSQHFVDAFQQSDNESILKKLKSAVVTKDFAPRPADESSQSIRFKVREPVPSFFGRENFLLDLDQQILKSHRTAADVSITSTNISRIFVVTGLGGIGKTETMRKYIHTYGHCYQHVVWIDAEDQKTAENQFRRLAFELQLSSKVIDNKDKDFDVILKEIYDRLCTSNTLLVFDNAEALDDSDPQRHGVARFLPKHTPLTHVKPVVLITSRHQDWLDLHPMPLPPWTQQESSEFIFRQLNLKATDANAKDATTLSEIFGRVPLALQAAVAVIRQESKWNSLMGKDYYTLQHLLRDYNNQGKREVLEKRPPGSPNATPLMLLWKVSLDKIRQQPHGYLATHMLNVMAHLSSTNIPEDLLFFIFNSNEKQSLIEAVELLVDYSFVDKFHASFSIHRMLQDVTLAHLEASREKHSKNWFMNLRIWTFLTSRRWSSSTPSLIRITTGMNKYWPTLPIYSEAFDAVLENLVHVTMTHVLPKAQNQSETDLRFIEFIEFVLKEIKDTRRVEAEKCCRVLITHFTNSALPSNSASPFKPLDSKEVRYLRLQLTDILKEMGQYTEAAYICTESFLYYFSLEDQENVIPEILSTKHSLAVLLHKQGEYELAIAFYSHVVDLHSKLHGPTHEFTLLAKNNLALALQNSGRLSEAKTLLVEILAVMMKQPEPLHLDIFTVLLNMATILKQEGHYDDALEIMREVAEVRGRVLGPLHAHTLISNCCIANVLGEQGKYEDALKLYAHVISSYEKASAASHPDCLIVKNNMALILGKQGRFDEAKDILRQVLGIKERLLGPSHKDTINTEDSMAKVLADEGNHAEALKLYEEVLDAREHLLGPSHVDTLSTKHNVAWVLEKQGKYAEALNLFEEVLELKTKHLGPTHPSILETNHNIGWVHLKMGNFEKAESIAKEVLAVRKATLHSDHPDCKDTEKLYENARLHNPFTHEKY